MRDFALSAGYLALAAVVVGGTLWLSGRIDAHLFRQACETGFAPLGSLAGLVGLTLAFAALSALPHLLLVRAAPGRAAQTLGPALLGLLAIVSHSAGMIPLRARVAEACAQGSDPRLLEQASFWPGVALFLMLALIAAHLLIAIRILRA